jgi:hypothetical protein
MKQFTIIIIITIFSFGNLQAQWYSVNSNTTEKLYDIFFIDSLEGYCAGGSDFSGTVQSTGVILKTIDGGENWVTIFSKDSCSIRNVMVIQENGNSILYAFGRKNSSSFLVSTNLNSLSFNWSVSLFNSNPREVEVFNNKIYFIDFNDNSLKEFELGVISTLDSHVTFFNVSDNGIICMDMFNYEIRYSLNNGLSWSYLITFPSTYGPSSGAYGSIKKINDRIIIKGTYPGVIVYSNDYGDNWITNYNAPEYSSTILSTEKIIGITSSNQITFTNDLGNTWINVGVFLGEKDGAKIKFFNYGFGLLFGEDGMIYKTNNSLNLIEFNETKFKKKINIFPNPSKQILKIENLSDEPIIGIELLDINGRSIRHYSNNLTELNISNIPSGEYILIVETKQNKFTEKVIIER